MRVIFFTLLVLCALPIFCFADNQLEEVKVDELGYRGQKLPLFTFQFKEKPLYQSHYSSDSGNLLIFFQKCGIKSVETLGQIETLSNIEKGDVSKFTIEPEKDGSLKATFSLKTRRYPQSNWDQKKKQLQLFFTLAKEINAASAPAKKEQPVKVSPPVARPLTTATTTQAPTSPPIKPGLKRPQAKKPLTPMMLQPQLLGSTPSGPGPVVTQVQKRKGLDAVSSLSVENMRASKIVALITPEYVRVDFPEKLDKKIDVKIKDLSLRKILRHIARKIDASVSISKLRVRFAPQGEIFPISDEKILEKMEFNKVALSEIFRALADLCEVNLLFDPSTDEIISKEVNFFVRELDYKSAFELLLTQYKLRAKVVSGRTIVILAEEEYKKKVTLAFQMFNLQNSEAKKVEERLKVIFDTKDNKIQTKVDEKKNTLELNCDPQLLPRIVKLVRKMEAEEVREVTERVPVWNAILKDGPDGNELDGIVKIIKESLDEHKQPPKMTVDPRAKSVILTGTTYQVEMAKKIIQALDVRRKQVLIHVRIMDVDVTDAEKMGLIPTTDGIELKSIHSLPWKLNMINLEASLDWLVKKNRARTRANPTLRVLDGKEATIDIGEEIPILIQTNKVINDPTVPSTGTGSTGASIGVDYTTATAEIIDIKLTLKLKPIIHQDGQISLDLDIHQDDLIEIKSGEGVHKGVRDIKTLVTVRNGETIVIGGLIKQSVTHEKKEWPLLSKIPFLKKLVRNRNDSLRETELLIFVTPTLVNLEKDDPPFMSRVKQGLMQNSATY
ncbi:type II secretion system protein GspD [Candidatus Riflebacteria bacterium]